MPLVLRRRRLLAGHLLFMAGLLLLLGARAAGAQSEGSTLSPEAYWALVADTQAAVAEAQALPPADRQALLAPLADRWAAARQVQLADGTRVSLSTQPFGEALRADEPALAALAAHLDALQAARAGWPAGRLGAEEAAELRAPLADILARPAFQWQEAEPTLLQRFWQAVLRALFELLPAGEGSLLLNYLLTALGALVLLGVLLLAARSLFGNLTRSVAEKEGIHPEGTLSADDALQQAQTLSQGGDYRNAVRYLYLSTLLLLDERGVLRYDRSRTNREYLRSVAGRPELAATLRGVVEVFDQTWYGYRPLDAASYAEYEAAVNDLKQVRQQ